jgi:hypothetical protein
MLTELPVLYGCTSWSQYELRVLENTVLRQNRFNREEVKES